LGDLVSTKLKLDDIERGPGIWAMNFNTITSELFTKAFNTWWGIWKNEIERFRNIQEWWDVSVLYWYQTLYYINHLNIK
jgi:hypothetical protein